MQNQNVWSAENVLPMSLTSVNNKSEFDLLTLRFFNAIIAKTGMARLVYETFMRGLNRQLQFESGAGTHVWPCPKLLGQILTYILNMYKIQY